MAREMLLDGTKAFRKPVRHTPLRVEGVERAVHDGRPEGVEVRPFGRFAKLRIGGDVNHALLKQDNVSGQFIHRRLLVLWVKIRLAHLLSHDLHVVVKEDGTARIGFAHLVIEGLHPST
jgi:hypothetical protein